MNEKQNIQKNTVVPNHHLDTIYNLLMHTEKLPGVNAEVGVYKGGTALLLAANSKKDTYLFDTFTGLPKENPKLDIHKAGDFNDTSYEQVQQLLKSFSNAKIYKGLFPQDTGAVISDKRFSFVYLDVDLYESTKDCLEFFYSKLVPGGILLSDDYGWRQTPGVDLAFQEFMQDKPEQLVVTHLQAHFIKL